MANRDIVRELRYLGSIDCPYGCDEVGNPAADAIEERDTEIAALRKQIKVLNAWGATKTCSTCAAWDIFPAEDLVHLTQKWGSCRAGMHDTTSDHFCAAWSDHQYHTEQGDMS